MGTIQDPLSDGAGDIVGSLTREGLRTSLLSLRPSVRLHQQGQRLCHLVLDRIGEGDDLGNGAMVAHQAV
jgi:hypothetical protein